MDYLILPAGFVNSILENSKLTMMSVKIAIYLADKLGFDEYKTMPRRTEIARYFKVSTTTVNDSLTVLDDTKILLSDPTNNAPRRFTGKFVLSGLYTVEVDDLDEYLSTHSFEEAINNPNIRRHDLMCRINKK